jgi:hypothetical protein
MIKKKKALFIVFFIFVNILLAKYSTKYSTKYKIDDNSVDFNFALVIKAGHSGIKFTDSGITNSLSFLITALRIDIDLSDYIRVGVIAGYQQNGFADSIDITALPLSLNLPDRNSESMILGFVVESEPFSINDYSLDVSLAFDYYKYFRNKWDINLAIANGTAESSHSFYMVNLSFLFKYNGFSTFTPFVGPTLNLISGNLNVSEQIMDFSQTQIFKYKQEGLIGLSAGVELEIGDNWDIDLKLNLFSENSLCITAFYRF